MQHFGDGRDWFFENRFGLFLHWGLYSIPGWREQHAWRLRVPRDEYEQLVARFNPKAYDPHAWLDLAAEVCMQYAVLTAKHHDGFCLFKSEHTDFHAGNSPADRDLFAQFMRATHDRGLPAEAYYSVPDWHHPHYPHQGRSHELPESHPGDCPDHNKYIAYLRAQVRELCTNYGELHGIWWDLNVTGDNDPAIHAMVRTLQPKAVINNRGFGEGDYSTPEREWGGEEVTRPRAFEKPVEACNSIGMQSWGWRGDEDYYAPRHIQASMAVILAKGGNYLLNVGPKPDGSIADGHADYLRGIGRWYAAVKEALIDVEYVTDALGNDTAGSGLELTRRGRHVYLILTQPPAGDAILLHPWREKPNEVTCLNPGWRGDNSPAIEAVVALIPSTFWIGGGETLRLRRLPVDAGTADVPVIRITFESEAHVARMLDAARREVAQLASPRSGPFGEPG